MARKGSSKVRTGCFTCKYVVPFISVWGIRPKGILSAY